MVLSINIYLHQNTWIYLAIVDSLLVFSLAYLKRRQANAELYSAKRNVDGLGHILRKHDGLLHEIIEGKMEGKTTRGRRRFQMLYDSANDGGFVALKRAAEYREGWRHREKNVKNLLYSRRLLC